MSVIQQWYRIGGQGGKSFTYEETAKGSVVYKLEAWASGDSLRGVKLYFSSGSIKMVGSAAEKYCGSITLDWESGESITKLSIWGNGAGTRCGAFLIETNRGQRWQPKMHDWGLKTEYQMQIGSGIMVGAWGTHGADVDSLGFLMLRKIIDTDMHNVEYDMRGDNLNPPQQKIALEMTIANPSDTDSDNGYQKVTKVNQTGGSWSISAGLTLGMSFSVSAGIPEVADVGGEASWELSVSGSYEQNFSTTEGYEISIPLIAPAREKTKIIVDYFEGKLSKLPFTAQMVYYLDNGAKFYTSVRGVYDGISTSEFVQETICVAVWDDDNKVWVPTGNKAVTIRAKL